MSQILCFSVKNIGQTFEKSFNFCTKLIGKFMRYVFYTFFIKKNKVFLSAIDAKLLQFMQFIWTLFQGKRPDKKEEMVQLIQH